MSGLTVIKDCPFSDVRNGRREKRQPSAKRHMELEEVKFGYN